MALPALRQVLPVGGSATGDLPASQPVPLVTVQLKRSAAQQADLDAFLKSVQTKGSAEYHHWLTPAQFAARFAPSAADVAPVTAWLGSQGLQVQSVSAGGMRLTASGTAAQVAGAFHVRLQRYALPAGDRVQVDGTPTVPDALVSSVLAVGGLDQTSATATADAVAGLEASIDANTAAVLAADLSGASASAEELNAALEQAGAQGQTVVLQHVTAQVLPAHALVLVSNTHPSATLDATDVTRTLRPDWQVAPGLPSNTLRALPDASAVDANALTAALQQIVTKAAARQGEVASTFYRLASAKGVFTHADTTVPVGTWSASDGLGTVDPIALVKAWPYGVTAPNSTTIALSAHVVTHGGTITLTATVTGSNGTPTGTVSFGSSQSGTLGSSTLDSTGTATYTLNTLAGGQYGFFGTYSGDNTYASTTTNVDTATVNPEAVTITGALSSATAVGGTLPILVTVKSPSGIGQPAGAVTVNAYGTNVSASAFAGTLVATSTAGTSAAAVAVPASNAGSFTFQASCTTDASFSCYQPASFAVTVVQGTPTVTLTQAGTATTATLTATVAAPAGSTSAAVPTGTVQFLDGTTVLGSGTVDSSGVAAYAGALGTGTTHSVSATYQGDANYVTASSNAAAATKKTPTVTLAMASTGTSLQVTVSGGSTATVVPTGNVQFLDNTTALATAAVDTTGVASYMGTYSSATGHTITAVYAGDSNYNTATSNVLPSTTKATAAAVLMQTSTAGAASAAFRVTVASATTSSNAPTGSVQFLDGTTVVGNSPLTTAGVATYTGTLATSVAHSITALYLGDANFNAVTSNAVAVAATTSLITTTTALTSSSGYTGVYGTALSLISVITPSSYVAAGTAPTGTITIMDAGLPVGTGTLSAGNATIVVSTLTVGAHALTAVYGGDSNYAASTSAGVAFSITPLTATLTASISPTGSVVYGNNASIAITVTAASGTVGPSGTVMATISGSNGTYSAPLVATTGSLISTANLVLPVPPPGTYTVTVKCNTNLVCNTVTLSLTTAKGFTTTTINGVTPTTPQAGTPVSISATVANTGTGSGAYTYSGMVSFYSNNKFLGSGAVVNGLATGTVVFLSASSQSVTAIYSGDVNWTGSTSDPITVTPTPIPATIVVASNTLTGIVGQNITLTAAVSAGITNTALVPSGTVAFYDTFNGIVVNLGSATVLSNGLNTGYAQLSTTGLRPGSHSILAVYSGDAVFLKTQYSNLVVNIGDFALTFAPASLSLSSGSTGKGVLTVAGLDGYSGAVALACTMPAGTETTCALSSALINTGGTVQFTVSTTKNTALLVRTLAASRVAGAALFGGLLSVCVLRRRRRVAALLSLLLVAVIAGGGCTQVAATDDSSTGTTTSTGTPLGTINLTITAATTDLAVNARHTYVIPVTVQ
ncbi:Ig-like domain repeat protein [Terriglobus roseus]|uniref:Ig-like domain repeat protein n=1 Tax=Terriglobus roseus TaxID=392734 RepID=UPI001BB085E9|nr:Ig-like domain repeat protein [Terriglobus roseus]